jgi:cellulose biosynthesis protein BcsQ
MALKTLSVYSLKGGVGKTATAVNLAYLAAADGIATVLCDFDPQGSSSYYLRARTDQLSAKKLVKGTKLKGAVEATDYEKLFVLPASLSFRKLSIELSEAKRSKSRIGDALEALRKDFDLAIIDPQAGIDLEAESVLRASDLVLMPVVPTILALESYRTALNFMSDHGVKGRRVRSFFSMADSRRKMHRETMESLRESDSRLLGPVIPNASEVERMGERRAPLVAGRRKTPAAEGYRALWSEVKSLLF